MFKLRIGEAFILMALLGLPKAKRVAVAAMMPTG